MIGGTGGLFRSASVLRRRAMSMRRTAGRPSHQTYRISKMTVDDIVVQKYGGSSLSDLERVRKVARQIVETREDGYDVVVVVSAMGDTTDDLLEMAKELSPNPSRRELDMLLSVGERISMALMSIVIQQLGHEAVSLTGSQCGIITTHSHANARIMDVRPFRVQDELAQGKIVIVAGYQGASYRRDVTTLGRGGSDTTAVALAAALDAEACEIYSDVDGIYNADPGVVLDADQLVELSHDEMLEMARSGARVLNEAAVEYARRVDIALYTRSAEGSQTPGTTIRRIDLTEEDIERAERGCPARAVSHVEQGLWMVAGTSADGLMAHLDDRDCAVVQWEPGAEAQAFVAVDDIHGLASFRESLEAIGDDVRTEMAGLVSLVGSGIGQRCAWAGDGLRSLNRQGIEYRDMAIYPDRLSWVVDCDDVEDAARQLHAEFLGELR